MIDVTKVKTVRCGHPVRIYSTDCGGNKRIHGAVYTKGGEWVQSCWHETGQAYLSTPAHSYDLIEEPENNSEEEGQGINMDISDLLPPPPEGAIHTRLEKPVPGQWYWGGHKWNKAATDYFNKYIVATMPEPVWEPPADLKELFKKGWIAMDKDTSWYWYDEEPVICHRKKGWASSPRIDLLLHINLPTNVDWEQSLFEVGEDQ